MTKSIKFIILIAVFFLSFKQSQSQILKPYFNKKEYEELLLISIRTTDLKEYYSKFSLPENYKMTYQSKEIGFGNLWQLWVNKKSPVAVISIRGTTRKKESVLSNLYAAMIPAKGELHLSSTETFSYELSSESQAAVHIGWLISMAYLSKDILPKIDSLYKAGTKDILLIGHSQGGAINFLLTAYLYNLQQKGKIPMDIRFKTYCSAPPKPGNLYFANYYEKLTQNGWGYTIVNSADWVPDTPLTIQTLDDLSSSNPFTNAKSEINNMKFPKNIILRNAYNKLDKPPRKAQKNYKKFLGDKTSIVIKKYLKEFTPPSQYFNSTNYIRTGSIIVLYADENYYKSFPRNTDNMLTHHNFEAYLYLLNQLEE